MNRRLLRTATGSERQIYMAPPRHGKSVQISQYLPAWFLTLWPHKRVILASYEADYAASWGAKVRDTVLRIGQPYGIKLSKQRENRWQIAGHGGEMVTAGVGGPIMGRGADLFIIDDPIKNAEEALSETYRRKTWDWYLTTAYSRLEPNASVVVMMTRWHLDDLVGMLLKDRTENWMVARFPAIAERDDILGRKPGEALWPERYPVDALMRIKHKPENIRWWHALYQQGPVPMEGRLLPREAWGKPLEKVPHCLFKVRFWDLASTKKARSDYTVGLLLGYTAAGAWVVLNVVRVRETPGKVKELVKQTAALDGHEVAIFMEEESGASGKLMTYEYRLALGGYAFEGVPSDENKVGRARPAANYLEAGLLKVANADWTEAFLGELDVFPSGGHDDQVDALSGAFNKAVKMVGDGQTEEEQEEAVVYRA